MKLMTRVAGDYLKVIIVTMALLAATCGIYGIYKLLKK